MTFGIQVFNANGSPSINTDYMGLYRIIYTEDFTGPGPFTRTITGFDYTKPGNIALMVPRISIAFSYYKIEYPASNQVKVTGHFASGYGGRLLVLGA